MRILLVEDDVMLGDGMVDALRSSGYTVDWLQQGMPALSALKSEEFAALVLDLNLPDIDGISLLRKLRREGQTLPVLILTARDALDDRVLGLDAGSDDYMVKPFALQELNARLRALVRRSKGQAQAAQPVAHHSSQPVPLDQRRHEEPGEDEKQGHAKGMDHRHQQVRQGAGLVVVPGQGRWPAHVEHRDMQHVAQPHHGGAQVVQRVQPPGGGGGAGRGCRSVHGDRL